MAVDNPERYKVPLEFCSTCQTKDLCEYEFQHAATDRFAVAEYVPVVDGEAEGEEADKFFDYRDQRFNTILKMAEQGLRDKNCQLPTDKIKQNIDNITLAL